MCVCVHVLAYVCACVYMHVLYLVPIWSCCTLDSVVTGHYTHMFRFLFYDKKPGDKSTCRKLLNIKEN